MADKRTYITAEFLQNKYDAVASLYSRWRAHCDEVEKVYKGEFALPQDAVDIDLVVSTPQEGRILLHKMLQMLAIRSDIRITVPPRGDGVTEQRRADRLEKALYGLLEQHQQETQRNVIRDGVWWALLRGRGVWQLSYEPYGDSPLPLVISTPDPYNLLIRRGKRGPLYAVHARYMSRAALWDYFEGLEPDLQDRLRDSFRVVRPRKDSEESWAQYLKVIEYWDRDVYAWSVNGRLIDAVDHGYGFMPIIETRVNAAPIEDERWNNAPLLSPVLEDLLNLAKLKTKMATATDLFYYPLILYKTADGSLSVFTADSAVPGEAIQVDPEFQPIILNPTPNQQLAEMLMQRFRENVNRGTLPEVVFVQDIPQASGFMVSQILSIVQDALADYRDGIEVALGRTLGAMLRLMERFADDQPGGRWEIPIPNGKAISLSASDIDGLYDVRVTVKPALPQDILQAATIFNQLYQPDNMTGGPRVDRMTAARVSGILDHVADQSAMMERIELETLLAQDEEARALYLGSLRARFSRELDEMRDDIERARAREERRARREAEREIDRGMSEDIVLPADILNDPQRLRQFADLVAQGQTPAIALRMLEEEGLPLGVPGAQGGAPVGRPDAGDVDIEALVRDLFGGAARLPDGLTGYEGIAPAALPPAMQGARPRQVVDADRVAIEAMEQKARRGALPPPR